MFKIFKKKKAQQTNTNEAHSAFELELTASVLAYEIARSDGNISDDELLILMNEIEIIAEKVGKEKHEIFKIIEIYSNDRTSFHEFIEDINKNFGLNSFNLGITTLSTIYLNSKLFEFAFTGIFSIFFLFPVSFSNPVNGNNLLW